MLTKKEFDHIVKELEQLDTSELKEELVPIVIDILLPYVDFPDSLADELEQFDDDLEDEEWVCGKPKDW